MEDLYSLAYAPTQGTCLEDLTSDDYNMETLVKEMQYMHNMCSVGFETYQKYFENVDNISPENAAALYCLTSYCNRIQSMAMRAGVLAGEVLSASKVDYNEQIKAFSTKARTEGLPPKDPRIDDLLVTEEDAEWEVPAAGKGRVDFKTAVSMISAPSVHNEPVTVSQQPVKAEFTRSKVRKATGYAKFTFSPGSIPDDSEEESPTRSPSSAASSKRSSSKLDSNDTGGESESVNGTQPFLLCGCYDPAHLNAQEILRRESSVSLGNIEEIQDDQADRHWNDRERHDGRFSRIRARVPTGHASLMKAHSDDLLDIILADDTEEARQARELLMRNTAQNQTECPDVCTIKIQTVEGNASVSGTDADKS